jgi:pectinesterase
MKTLKLAAALLLILLFCRVDAQQKNVKYDFVVARDGSGNFRTIQEALDSVPVLRNYVTTIFVKNGVYKEKLILAPIKTKVKLVGESVEGTILTYSDHAKTLNRFGEEIGTSGSSSFYVYGNDFIAENITFENAAGPVAQAVAVRVDGDRVIFHNCRFKGFIDTLYPHGEKSRQYYKNCQIEGTSDFIFGWSTVVFDSCNIIVKHSGGTITAASTLPETKYGFVFLHCRITGDIQENSVYLGRPWRPYAKTVFIGCYLDKLVHTEGWNNWNKPDAEKTSYYAEYKNFGPGSDTTKRVPWSHQLTDQEAESYNFANIYGDWFPVLF